MDRLAILTMTHGVSDEEHLHGNEFVKQWVADLGFPVPSIHGFIEAGTHLQPAVAELSERGVDVIVAVILYPLSANKEVDKVYLEMGLKPGKLRYKFFPIATPATIYPSKQLEAHPALATILRDRLLAISTNAAEEACIICTHGEFTPRHQKSHEGSIDELADLIREQGPWGDVRRAAINPKDETLDIARAMVEAGKRVLVTHFFTEPSGFTTSYIPRKLGDLPEDSWAYNPEPLIPHPAMRDYILFRTAETLAANGRDDLIFPEAREVHERYRDYQAGVTLPWGAVAAR